MDVVTALQCWGSGGEWRPDLVTSVLLGPDADSFSPPAAAVAQVVAGVQSAAFSSVTVLAQLCSRSCITLAVTS